MAKTTKHFTAMASITVQCDVGVNAESLEDALQAARKLGVLDFIQLHGELIDDEVCVKGIFEG